jgi:membrane protease YdiL (CAAX protease family)
MTARFSLNRKTVALYLPLLVIVGCWLLNLLTLSRMRLAEKLSLTQLVPILLAMTVVTWGGILLLLRFQGEGLGSIGLGREKWRKSLVPGVLFGLVAVSLQAFVLMPLGRRCWPNSQAPSLNHWLEGPGVIPLWLFLACLAGPKEELPRSFILTRFEKAFGRKGLMISLLVQPIMFGFGHLYQGQAAAVVAGIVGFMYALIYLRRRSCWESAIAHSTYDLVLVSVALLTLRAKGAPHG